MTDKDPEPGTVLGRYQLLSGVGQGGMGRVWAARQLGSTLERLVAVKTALGGQGQTREFRRLFMDEARIASMIHHPHVCGVYELGEQDGTWFLVMEWCDGVTLRQLIDQVPGGKVNLSIATRIVANVAAGLHAAHELEDSEGTKLEVVHRDVSPQNILISCNGHVKVTDFGVARAKGQLHRPTETGEMKGKLAYMAPEQVTAKEVDRRADVFALGCVLYEMTVGQRPFQGEGALSTLYQLLEQTVAAPIEVDPEFPPELSAIIVKALAKNADDRFDTSEQLRVALESWLASSGEPGTEREIAALLAAVAHELIEEKSNQVRMATKELREPSATQRQPATSPDSQSTSPDGPLPERLGASTVDRGLSAGRMPESNSSWLLPIGAAAAVLAVVVVLAKGSWGGRETLHSSRVAVAVSATPAALPEPVEVVEPVRQKVERIRLRIRTEPPGGQLRLDDGPPVMSPFVIEAVLDGSSHHLRASAPGRVEQMRTVLYDQDQQLVIVLPQEPKVKRPKARRSRSKRVVVVAPAVVAEPVLAEKSKEPAARSQRSRQRDLDSENPFGQ